MDKGGGEGGSITIFFENFLSYSTEKLRRGNLCFRKVLVSQNFMDKRGVGREYHDFSSKNLLSHSTKKLLRETLCVSGNFCYRKTLWIRGGGGREGESITILRQKIFCLTVLKKFVGELFPVSLIWGIEKCYACEGYVTIFCRKFLSHRTETIHRETLLCCVSENFR